MEQYTNLASSTLASAIVAGATTLTLASGASFPTDSFTILIGTELIRVTSRATNTLTIVRGTEGTTAAGQVSGSTVTHVISTSVLNAIRAEINSEGSTLPTAARIGNRHQFLDGYHAVFTAAGWQYYYHGMKVKPPNIANFGFFADNGQITFTQVGNMIVAASNSTTDQVNNQSLFGKTIAGTQVTIGFENLYDRNFESHAMLGLSDASNINVNIIMGISSTSAPFYYILGQPNTTSFNVIYGNAAMFQALRTFLRIRVTAGTRFYEYSYDNINWTIMFSHADGTYVVPTRVFFGHCRRAGVVNSPTLTKIFHFEES